MRARFSTPIRTAVCSLACRIDPKARLPRSNSRSMPYLALRWRAAPPPGSAAGSGREAQGADGVLVALGR